MKNSIHLPKDVKIAIEDLKNRTGINIEKYKTPQLAASISNIVTFPAKSFLKIFLFPLLFSAIIFFISIVLIFLSKGILTIIIFFVVGILLAIVNGFILGLQNLFKSFYNDTSSILFLSLEQTKMFLTDLKKNVIAPVELPRLSDLIKIFLYAVVLPCLFEIVQNRVKIINKLLIKFINRTFNIIIPQILSFIEKQEQAFTLKSVSPKVASQNLIQNTDSILKRSIMVIDKTNELLNSKLSHYRSMVLNPIKNFLIVSSSLSLIILLLILF